MGRPFYLFFWGIILLGCENVLEIELEHVDPEIVVTCVFTENTPWQVLIQHTVGIQEDLVIPSVIEHAIVTIEGNDGTFLELIHRGGGFYYADTSLPQPGVTYTLKVEADGFTGIVASDQIPKQAKVQNVRYDEDSRRIAIILDDEDGVDNYYSISIWADPGIYQQAFSVLNAELAEQMKRLAIHDPFAPYVDRPEVENALIHDRQFDGDQITILLSMGFGSGNPSTYVRSISEAYYNYYLSKIVQENTEGLPFAEPAPLRSNVIGGQGVFAGYSLRVDGDLTPEKMKNQAIGAYYRSETQIYPSDPDAILSKIEFTLHPDHSVTGFMQYPSENDSRVTISLGGGYTITSNESYYYLVQLHHSTDTFFRNVALRIHNKPRGQGIYLSTDQTVTDRNGNFTTISRTFSKQEEDGSP